MSEGNILKPDSVRDYGYMILNFEYAPSVVISDIPHMVAAHLNIRLQQGVWWSQLIITLNVLMNYLSP